MPGSSPFVPSLSRLTRSMSPRHLSSQGTALMISFRRTVWMTQVSKERSLNMSTPSCRRMSNGTLIFAANVNGNQLLDQDLGSSSMASSSISCAMIFESPVRIRLIRVISKTSRKRRLRAVP